MRSNTFSIRSDDFSIESRMMSTDLATLFAELFDFAISMECFEDVLSSSDVRS